METSMTVVSCCGPFPFTVLTLHHSALCLLSQLISKKRGFFRIHGGSKQRYPCHGACYPPGITLLPLPECFSALLSQSHLNKYWSILGNSTFCHRIHRFTESNYDSFFQSRLCFCVHYAQRKKWANVWRCKNYNCPKAWTIARFISIMPLCPPIKLISSGLLGVL